MTAGGSSHCSIEPLIHPCALMHEFPPSLFPLHVFSPPPQAAGEFPWVRGIIERHHDAAAAKGLRIVPCCGYDSIPSDLGALMVVEHM